MLRGWLARLTAPIAFRTATRSARMLESFALAEEGSAIDLALAARNTGSLERSALYLRHAADEGRHAHLFRKRARTLRGPASGQGLLRADSEHLFERLGEETFVALVHRGEQRGLAQFRAYRAHFARRGDGAMRDMFDQVIRDEARHEAYSGKLLLELSGGERGARQSLRRAARWEALRAWQRAGASLGGLAYALCMLLLYVASAPLSLLIRVARPRQSGFIPGREP